MKAVCFVCGVERSCVPAGPFGEPMCEDCMTDTRRGMGELAKDLVKRPSPRLTR